MREEIMAQMSLSEETKKNLREYWAKHGEDYVPPPPPPEPVMGESKLAPVGTRVRITGIDPNWGRACCGHPAVGSVGVIDERYSPEGKTTVAFNGDGTGQLMCDDGSFYSFDEDDEDPIAVYVLDTILEVIPCAS